ncbi:MAG: SpoIID/LytB domain-containing protein [bacterium]
MRYKLLIPIFLALLVFTPISEAFTQIYVRVLVRSGTEFNIEGRSITVNMKGDTSQIFKDVVSISGKMVPNGVIFAFNLPDMKERDIVIGLNTAIDVLGEDIYINGNPYRGSVRILFRGEKILVINILPLEDYLYSVVPSEMPYYWPIEALKAQAVLARTYTLKALSRNSKKDYDLTDSIDSQLYKGKTEEHQSTNEAVDATKGEVVLYNNLLAEVFYHSTCGGHTEDATNIWNIEKLPYLKGVECNYCTESQWKSWQRVIKREDWKNLIGDGDMSIRYDSSGRLMYINGISGTKVRDVFHLPSTFIVGIEVKEDRVIINGKGNGHGVGLCQWGARGMAERGFNYKEIIAYYFPGVTVDAYRGF